MFLTVTDAPFSSNTITSLTKLNLKRKKKGKPRVRAMNNRDQDDHKVDLFGTICMLLLVLHPLWEKPFKLLDL